jgi:hypothetical protein
MLQLQGTPLLRPELYAEPPHERLGFLAQPAAEQQQQRPGRRRQALGRLACRRWQSAAQELEAERRAEALCRCLLRRRAVAGLQAALAAARAAALKADQQRQKWRYLHFASCWAAWRCVVAARRRLAAMAQEASALHRGSLLAKALAALQRQVARQQVKRRAWSQAASFHCFCLLVHSLDGWRAWLAARARRQRLLAAGVLHWAARLCRAALEAWRLRTQHQLKQQRQRELAAAHRCHAVLAAWRALVQRLQGLRQAAAVTIEQALFGNEEQLAKMCLLSWRVRVRCRAERRDSVHLAARLRRCGLLGAAWRG